MKGFLRRFAAVGAVVTAADVAVLAVLRLQLGLPVVAADAIAITAAAALAWTLHRVVTFADDPHLRWVREPVVFAGLTVVAGAVDIGVLRLAATGLDTTTAPSLLAAKALALAVAGVVRLAGYRRYLFRAVRGDQVRRRSRGPAPGRSRLSVIVPAYECEATIGQTVGRLRADLAGVAATGGLEVVVVDDGSTDGTAGAARRAGADVVIAHEANRGKGAAVRTGMLAASGRTLVFTDADLAYPPEQLVGLLEEIEAGADVVVGSRRHVGTTTLARARRLRELTGRVFNLLTLAVVLGEYRDTQCGLKAFRSDVAQVLFSRTRVDGFAFDVEVLHLAERYHLSLTEIPVEVANTQASTVRVGADAWRMLADLLRIRRWASQGAYDLGADRRLLLPADGAGPGGDGGGTR